MNKKPKTTSLPTLATVVAAAAATLLAANVAQAQFVLNGDLELAGSDGALLDSWTNSGAVSAAATPIDGAFSAKLVRGTNGHLLQTVNDPGEQLSAFSISFDLALANPGTGKRAFQINLPHSGTNQINMVILDKDGTGMGDIEVYNGSGWERVLSGAVAFSPDENTLAVNTITLTGDYSSATPSYSVSLGGSTSADMSAWQGSGPAPGSRLQALNFQSGNIDAAGWYIVDNVSVIPEPSTYAALLGAATLGIVALRRRRR